MALPEIRLLKAAIALSEELNFSRAAYRLHIGQSTLSKQIFELESELGLRLFERNHRLVEVTDSGRGFVEDAREAILHVERAVISAKAALNGADVILHLGKSPLGDPFLVSTLLSIRLPLFPKMRTKLWSNYSNELAHQVITGNLDVAVITGVPDNPKLSCLKVAEYPFYIAMAEDDELAASREIQLEQMHGRDWIILGRHANSFLYDRIEFVASKKNVRAADIHPVMGPEDASELIREHRGLAFLSRTGAWRIARDGITMRPLAEKSLPLVTNLVVRSDSKSRLVSEFVRAAGRKFESVGDVVQKRLPLAG